ncbi:hypothetical protein [Nocardiopsis sp. RV163]|uniref:hypothetical protein n=1 Tax=Nocardiopsis sp. RV163 TaxID=1661388 RepID=UPI00064B94A4|nr:hypothetical protein [Nocardiopsis sp. RV163]
MTCSDTLPSGRPLLDHVEIALPGALIGLVAGLFATAVAATAGLTPVVALALSAGLGAPLALFGAGYCVLLARGVFQVGAVAPMAVYWLVAFPLSRLIDSCAVAWALGGGTVLGEPLLSFLAFQAMLSTGFTIGFLWLHERIAPRWLLRVRGHNPVAASLVERYLEHAVHLDRRRGGSHRGASRPPSPCTRPRKDAETARPRNTPSAGA